MELKIYNTRTRKKEVFFPIDKKFTKMYSCGPTVYSYQHVGNMRTYIFSDILKRVLLFNGFKVNHVINVTDVGHLTSDADEGEDKVELAATKEGKSADEITRYYFDIFRGDLIKLNILKPNVWAKATEHINEQIDLIKKLEEKGFTYLTSDGVYFDSSKFSRYGDFAKLNLEGLKHGKRVAKGEKKNKSDFALWKFSSGDTKRQQEWDSPWGIGFPGWHIECSAMSMKYLGENFDIHTGGEDHIAVHHTNEVAQSECATGKRFVNYWMHSAFLLSDGKKVSKSKGGLYTISDLERKNYDPLSFRYLCLMTHYRKQMNFSLENLEAAQNAFHKLKRKIIVIKNQTHKGNNGEKYLVEFQKAVNDDLNTAKALKVFIELIEESDVGAKEKLKLLEKFDEVLGLNVKEMKEEKIPKEIMDLVKEREKLREDKKWEEADILRNRIKKLGYLVEDSDSGVSVVVL